MEFLDSNLDSLLQLIEKEPNHEQKWFYSPEDMMRESGSFVGLHNLGATCYMNSLIQQLFMIPGFRRDLLAAKPNVPMDPSVPIPESDNLLVQLQWIFANLQESFVKEFNTYPFVSVCKDFSGQPMNPFVQMDVDEFYNLLFDRLEAIIKGTEDENLFKRHFAGTLAQQIKSKDCSHVSEREESFFALQCEVKGLKNIEESLEKYIEGEILDGDNSYHCSICDCKVSAVKRMCIKKLPQHLLFHLKRFDFNFQTMRRLKINDEFEFPHVIDMEPYTDEFLSRGASQMEIANLSTSGQHRYRLGGVLIHQGTADSGHYYSFIKSRDSNGDGDWFHFNDASVKKFDIKDLPKDAFGGLASFGTKKNYSAYILVYDKIESSSDDPNSTEIQNSSLLPERFSTLINRSNEEFAWHLRLFSDFMNKHALSAIELTRLNTQLDLVPAAAIDLEIRREKAFKLALQFFLKVVLRSKHHASIEIWLQNLISMITSSTKNAHFCVDFLLKSLIVLRELCLECGSTQVRHAIAKILGNALAYLRQNSQDLYFGSKQDGVAYKTMNVLVTFLPSIRLYWRTWTEFWQIITYLSSLGKEETEFLLENRTLTYIFDIFMGNDSRLINSNGDPVKIGDRKQTPDFDVLAHCLFHLIRNVDLAEVLRNIYQEKQNHRYQGLGLLFAREHSQLIIMEKLFCYAREPFIVRNMIDLFRNQLVKEFPSELLLVYRAALKTSTEAAKELLEAFELAVKKVDVDNSVENQNEFSGLIGLIFDSFQDVNIPGNFVSTGMKLIRTLGPSSKHLYPYLFRLYKSWVFLMLTHSSDEARAETEEILKEYLFRGSTSTNPSPIMSSDKSKVRIVEKLVTSSFDDLIPLDPKPNLTDFAEWLFAEMESAVEIISGLPENLTGQAPLYNLADIVQILCDIESVKPIAIRYFSVVVQIALALNSKEIENDESRYRFMKIIECLMNNQPLVLEYLTTKEDSLKLLTRYFINGELPNRPVVDYNVKSLPVYLRIALACCEHDERFCRKLGDSSHFRWTIRNIFLMSSYKDLISVFTEVLSRMSHIVHSFRNYLVNDFYYAAIAPQTLSKISSLVFASAISLYEYQALLRSGKMAIFVEGSARIRAKGLFNLSFRNTIMLLERISYYSRLKRSHNDSFTEEFEDFLTSDFAYPQNLKQNIDIIWDLLIGCLNFECISEYRSICCYILTNLCYEESLIMEKSFIQKFRDESYELLKNDPFARRRNLSLKYSPFIDMQASLQPLDQENMYERVAMFWDDVKVSRLDQRERSRIFKQNYRDFARFLVLYVVSMNSTDEIEFAIDLTFYLVYMAFTFEYVVGFELLYYVMSKITVIRELVRSESFQSYLQEKLETFSQLLDRGIYTENVRKKGFETFCKVAFKLKQNVVLGDLYDNLVTSFIKDVAELLDDPNRNNELLKWSLFYHQAKAIDQVPVFGDYEEFLRTNNVLPEESDVETKTFEYFEKHCIQTPPWPYLSSEDLPDLETIDMITSNMIELAASYDDTTALDEFDDGSIYEISDDDK